MEERRKKRGALANHNLANFQPKGAVILPKLLVYFLNTNWAEEKLNMFATGMIHQSYFLNQMVIPVLV